MADDDMQPIMMAVLVGVLTIMIVASFMMQGGSSDSSTKSKSKSKEAPSQASSKEAPKAKVKAKKSKKISKAKAAPVEVPAPEPEEEEQPPEPTTTGKSKKKKNKKGGAAVSEPAPAPTPAPAPAPTPPVEEVPAPLTKNQKKNLKKKQKKTAAAVVAPVVEETKPVVTTEDDDDSDDDDIVLLLAMAKKGKGKTTKSASSSTPSGPVTTRNGSSTQPGKYAKTGAAASASDPQKAPEVVLDIGSDPLLLIGPGGSTIQGITANSGARLDILKNTPEFGQNRVRITAANVNGEDPNACIAKAVEMVQALLDEKAAIVANSKTVTLSSTDINGQNGVKSIIGRKGETIQSILQQCNGQVKINANVEAGTVDISGPKMLVDKAVKLCKQAVFGETQSTMKLESRSAMNIVFGKDFKNIQELQSTTGSKLDMDKGTYTLKLSGKSEQVAAARTAVASLLTRCKGTYMDIKSADVGAVYGKGGTTIRNIQDKTGAFIEVQQLPSSTTADGEATVKCSIMGEPDACAQARELIVKALSREVELKPGEVADTLSLGGAATPAVIGRGGSKIKELESAHGVSLNVNGDVCRIVGKESNVKAAKAAIKTIIDPILATAEAQKEATIAAESGDSAWQGDEVPQDNDADGW
jgi:rRNA processing protein Krr1/Pno1